MKKIKLTTFLVAGWLFLSLDSSIVKATENGDYIYTTDRVNIRTSINTDSVENILITSEPNTKLKRIGNNAVDGWSTIVINGNEYYISNEFVTTKAPTEENRTIDEQLNDLRYMSAIIFAEAGNQCRAGKEAVGIVVANRVKSDIYEDSVYDVIFEQNQFEPVANGSLYDALYLYDNGELSEEVVDAARGALCGNTCVYYNGVEYNLDGYLYFSRYLSSCRVQIQDHMFK